MATTNDLEQLLNWEDTDENPTTNTNNLRLDVDAIRMPTPPLIEPQPNQIKCAACWINPVDPLTFSCSRVMCRECLNRWVQNISMMGVAYNLWCPGCGSHELPLSFILENCRHDVAEKFQNILFLKSLNLMSGLTYCPDPNCGFAFVYDKDAPGCTITCPACSRAFCLDCKEPHEGLTCQEYQTKISTSEEYVQFKLWADQNSAQVCAQCSSVVEKNGGCNHMTCLKCRYEWCWTCKQPFAGHVCPQSNLQPRARSRSRSRSPLRRRRSPERHTRRRSRDRDAHTRRRSRSRSRSRSRERRWDVSREYHYIPRDRERERHQDRQRERDWERERERYRRPPYDGRSRSPYPKRSRSRSRDRYWSRESRDFRDRSPPRHQQRTVDRSLRVSVAFDRRVY